MTSILSFRKDRKSMNITTTYLEKKEIIAEEESGKKWLRQLLRVRTQPFRTTRIFPVIEKVTMNTQAFAFREGSTHLDIICSLTMLGYHSTHKHLKLMGESYQSISHLLYLIFKHHDKEYQPDFFFTLMTMDLHTGGYELHKCIYKSGSMNLV